MAVKTKIYTIKVSSKVTYGWTAKESVYKGLENDLGIESSEPGKAVPEGTVFGGKLKPPRINIRTTQGKSYIRFISPEKLDEMVYQKKLIGKKINGQDICWVSVKSN